MNRKNSSTDYEYVKNIFDSDDIHAPESLSEDSVMKLINESHPEEAGVTGFRKASSGRTFIRRAAAVAACAVLILAGIPLLYKASTAPPDISVRDGELYTFSSANEIERLIRSMEAQSRTGLFTTGSGQPYELSEGDAEILEDAADMDAGMSSEAPAAAEGKSFSSDISHSETYLQVEEVDESDIVKTDGRYIYYVNNDEEVVILRADGGKTEQVSRIGYNDIENYIHEIFLKDDTLVTIGTVYDRNGYDGSTGIAVYDISDRSHPQLVNVFRQSGSIVSGRMIGNYVYLVTNDYVYDNNRRLPLCGFEGSVSSLDAGDICCVPEPAQASYIILSAVDISSDRQISKTKAVFGSSDNIYCSENNLYTAVQEWNNSSVDTQTRIVRAGLDGLKIRFDATALVHGRINDQFSMDERDGFFRIATTSYRDGMDVNNLFILDDHLKETGALTGFARNESIRAVKFIGNRAYVITYKAIDPLFVIDLSEPSSPRIEGEVKIDGFSTLLIPVSSDRLLGIGHATGDNGYGGEYASGLKLALFDVSDPAKPKVISSKEYKDMESPAQNTHKALIINKKEGWYAVPYEIYDYDDVVIEEEDGSEGGYETGILVFSADDKIRTLDKHSIGNSMIYRGVYIGDHIYALDGEGAAGSFSTAGLTK